MTTESVSTILPSVRKNSFILTIFAIATAGLISSIFIGTKERIATQERLAAQRALNEIIPHEQHDNDLLTDIITLDLHNAKALGYTTPVDVHVAKKQGNITAYIFPAIAPDGYSGDIKLIVGINIDGTIAGVRALSHKETPGLGDKVDIKKSDWITSFDGLSLQNPLPEKWKVKKDGGHFDQFTGATITPRAVVRQVKSVLTLFTAEKQHFSDKAKINQQKPSDKTK